MTRVKICGITTPDDRDAAVAAGADALGFTVDVPVDTPREIAADEAAELVAGVPPFVTTVLVTMPTDPGAAVDLLDRVGADAIQVHGDLGPEGVREIREGTGRTTVVAVDADDPATARRFDGVADGLLVDSAGERGRGGTGRTHDWEATRSFADSVDSPVILAGGLTPENVATAVEMVAPYAVDVASGVERRGGRKDHEAVAAFVAAATRPREAPRR